jgi:prepilin-type N-terminal cleavage/methylation domain-containing protein
MIKKGFTLAEILITLAIIGVVAALTIPAVTKSYKATELKTQFKKSYSILNQAIARMNLEEGVVVSKMPARTFAPIFKKYVKMYKDCRIVDCVYTNNIVKYKTYAKDLNITPSPYYWDDGQLILENGMLVMIENPNAGVIQPTMISVDINGMNKGPNVWGYDVFTFQVMESSKLLPMGADGTMFIGSDYCSTTSTSTINGITCAYYAFTNEDYFKNLP